MKTSRILIICAVLTANRSPADEPKEKQQPPPLPSRFAELVRETEKAAETVDQPEAKVKILVELAGARRWTGDKVEAKKTLERALTHVEKIEREFGQIEWHLMIAKQFAALGAKAEASRLLVAALAATKKNEEEHEGMTWRSSVMLEMIAREQVKLGERERAGETLKLAVGWADRSKNNYLRLDLFQAQVETKFLAEAERNFDRLWTEASGTEASGNLEHLQRFELINRLFELVRPGEREQNKVLLGWLRKRVRRRFRAERQARLRHLSGARRSFGDVNENGGPRRGLRRGGKKYSGDREAVCSRQSCRRAFL